MIKVSATKGGGAGTSADAATEPKGKNGASSKAASSKVASSRALPVPPVKVSFVLPVSETPEPVSVCGDFNGWDPLAHPLKKRANGTRSASVELAPGRYAFKYLSGSGTWFTDPEAHAHEANEYGETNSILEL